MLPQQHRGNGTREKSRDELVEATKKLSKRPGLVSWPQYYRQQQQYMELGLMQTLKQNLKKERVHFASVVLTQQLEQSAGDLHALTTTQWSGL
ncbi:hypothetical protein KUCAC02_021455 [Chaenocephalus aceratus]|uniref:Uncharacterized protein n=1 Tax=Chaenocephalus aceratus TaxID=36190 RepID=A0ACB9XHJ7_CHAAC|nr:hypothetical protein KUCAC02_021455 [Chaenocephalus aceratus]